MFVSMRQYLANADMPTVARRVQEGFVPLVRGVEGVSGYYLVDLGGDAFLTVTFGESRAAVEASADVARKWVAEQAPDLVQGAPTVVNDEVLVQS